MTDPHDLDALEIGDQQLWEEACEGVWSGVVKRLVEEKMRLIERLRAAEKQVKWLDQMFRSAEFFREEQQARAEAAEARKQAANRLYDNAIANMTSLHSQLSEDKRIAQERAEAAEAKVAELEELWAVIPIEWRQTAEIRVKARNKREQARIEANR